MDKKDYVIAFLSAFCVTLILKLANFAQWFTWELPTIPDEIIRTWMGGIVGISIICLTIILAVRIKRTPLPSNTNEEMFLGHKRKAPVGNANKEHQENSNYTSNTTLSK